MAHKKAGGSSKNGRDSQGQRRGVKVFDGQLVKVLLFDEPMLTGVGGLNL